MGILSESFRYIFIVTTAKTFIIIFAIFLFFFFFSLTTTTTTTAATTATATTTAATATATPFFSFSFFSFPSSFLFLLLSLLLTASVAYWLRRPPRERKIRGSNPACDEIFPGQVILVTSKLALQWLPCQAPGVLGSALGPVGPVSVYCAWVR